MTIPKNKTKSKSKSRLAKTLGWSILIGFIIVGALAYFGYLKYYVPNVTVKQQKEQSYLYIRTGSSFEQVMSSLEQSHYLKDVKSFEWMAVKMNYPEHIKAGKYRIKDGMSNRELIHMLRAGRQTPVEVVFNNERFKRDVVSDISRQLEADSATLLHLLNNHTFLSKYGMNPQTVMSVFIPNTYEFYWNTNAEDFMLRMFKEYKRFWNEDRMSKCQETGLSQTQVSILASIIEEETQKNDEKKIIAGLYINRLHKGMLLQADPTVRFAYGDFSIKRILNKYKEIDSPYNTYRYLNLPPGPICIPSISSIDAVLNYQRSEYLYFCAREDFSGYHNFARTLEQHNQNAQRYHKALTRSGIMR